MSIKTKFLNSGKAVVKNIFYFLISPRLTNLIGEFIFWFRGICRKNADIELLQARYVLVVRLDAIGDVVLTVPFLRELRKNMPYAWITLVIKPEVYNLMQTCPYVNEVLTFDSKVSNLLQELIRHFRTLKFAIFYLWKRKFDLAILPRWDVDYDYGSFLAYFSGAIKRIAYSEYVTPLKHRLNKGYDKLFTHLITNRALKHEVEYNLEVIKFFGGKIYDDSLELWLDKDDEYFGQIILKENNINKDYFLTAFSLGARELTKRWPIERFLELIEWSLKKIDSKIILLGNRDEIFLGKYIEKYNEGILSGRIINMIGKTTLRQSIALLKYCKLFIGTDTGIKHIAASMQVPIVEISCCPKTCFESDRKSPYRFGPWRVKNIVVTPEKPIAPCKDKCISPGPHCILQVTVEDVKEGIISLLSSRVKNHYYSILK